MNYSPIGQASISAEFASLDGLRQGMMSRLERLSELTVASVLTDEFYETENDELTNSASSLGAQAATHLANKLMLTLFAPSNPFVRLDIEADEKERIMQEFGLSEDQLTTVLAQGERAVLAEMERVGIRPTLFEGLLHLVILGNVLMDLSSDEVVMTSIRDYVTQRDKAGRFIKLIIREATTAGSLLPKALDEYKAKYPNCKPDTPVTFYRRIVWDGKLYRETAAVEEVQLSPAFNASYRKERCPYHPLTWRLPLKQNYGVGRCEDYARDLGCHDLQSEALTDGCVLAAQFRWVVNPAGGTRVEDFLGVPNGGAVPGSANDVELVFANIGQQLNTVLSITQEYARRIGHGFLLGSAVTRDAERVTVEEIRMQAQELESSLGGVYSRLALDIQLPLAYWLLDEAKVKIEGTKISPVILTGLDALSRSADLQRLTGFITDLAALENVPPQTRVRLNEANVVSDMAAGRGVDRSRYLVSEEEVQNRLQAQQQAAVDQAATVAGTEAGAAAGAESMTQEQV